MLPSGWITRMFFLVIIIMLIGVIYINEWHHILTLDQLRNRRDDLVNFADKHLFTAITVFVIVYILVTTLSIPGATIMTLAGGAVFGRWVGFICVLLAATIGATTAMLVARYLLGASIQSKYSEKQKYYFCDLSC